MAHANTARPTTSSHVTAQLNVGGRLNVAAMRSHLCVVLLSVLVPRGMAQNRPGAAVPARPSKVTKPAVLALPNRKFPLLKKMLEGKLPGLKPPSLKRAELDAKLTAALAKRHIGLQDLIAKATGSLAGAGALRTLRSGLLPLNQSHVLHLLADAKLACVAEHAALCFKGAAADEQRIAAAAAAADPASATTSDGETLPEQAAKVDTVCLTRIASKAVEDDPRFGSGCRDALAAHRAALAINPTLDTALMVECRDTVQSVPFVRYCEAAFPKAKPPLPPLLLTGCLRKLRAAGKLGEGCSLQVQRLQSDEARDMTLDARLFAACEAETKGEGPCAGVAAGGGRLRACLEKEAAAQKAPPAVCRSAGPSGGLAPRPSSWH